MRVLVTGASGFIGSHVVRTLIEAGHEPIAFIRDADKFARALTMHGITDAVPQYIGDITAADAVSDAMTDADAVIHTVGLAGLTGIDPTLMSRVNTDGTRVVLDTAIAAALDPIVHISSVAAMFPPAGDVLTSEDPITTHPSVYASTKGEAERLARAAQDAGHPVVTVYPGGVYGPDDPGSSDLLEGNAMMLEKGAFVLPTGGGNSFVDVRDLSQAIVTAIEPGRGPRRYMAGGHWTEWAEWVDAFEAASGRKIRIFEVSPSTLGRITGATDRIGALVPKLQSPLSAESAAFMSLAKPTDDSRLQEELHVTWRPLQDSVTDFVNWMVADGRVKLPSSATVSGVPSGSKLPEGKAGEVVTSIVTSDIFRAIGPRVFPGMHRAMAKLSGGKFVPGAGLVLTAIGAKSGQPRQTPLETIPRDDGSYLVVGSNWAQEHHPAWTGNLIANPDAEILVRGKTIPVTTKLLQGPEREQAWTEALAHWPVWNDYVTITDREFRIFSLTPR